MVYTLHVSKHQNTFPLIQVPMPSLDFQWYFTTKIIIGTLRIFQTEPQHEQRIVIPNVRTKNYD